MDAGLRVDYRKSRHCFGDGDLYDQVGQGIYTQAEKVEIFLNEAIKPNSFFS